MPLCVLGDIFANHLQTVIAKYEKTPTEYETKLWVFRNKRENLAILGHFSFFLAQISKIVHVIFVQIDAKSVVL